MTTFTVVAEFLALFGAFLHAQLATQSEYDLGQSEVYAKAARAFTMCCYVAIVRFSPRDQENYCVLA
jgi:hypothetical protein